MIRGIEVAFERALFLARWLMAPIYLGLALALGMVVVVFARELAHYLPRSLSMSYEGAILAALALIDLALVGNLLVIVVLSGYESVVSRIEPGEGAERPAWMGRVDFSGLKIKLVASIVAISGIHLLKRFMEIGGPDPAAGPADRELMWLTVIHVTFVLSGLLLAVMDWFGARGDH